MHPALIVVDHAHFQYNSVSLGLHVLSMLMFTRGRHLLGSAAFVCAVNYKQMELFHALPIFVYLLSASLTRPTRIVHKLTTLASVAVVTLGELIQYNMIHMICTYSHVCCNMDTDHALWTGLYTRDITSYIPRGSGSI